MNIFQKFLNNLMAAKEETRIEPPDINAIIGELHEPKTVEEFNPNAEDGRIVQLEAEVKFLTDQVQTLKEYGDNAWKRASEAGIANIKYVNEMEEVRRKIDGICGELRNFVTFYPFS